MTVEELVQLVKEYADLCGKFEEQKQHTLTGRWSPTYSDQERERFLARIQAIEGQVKAVGLTIGRDEHGDVNLYLVEVGDAYGQ